MAVNNEKIQSTETSGIYMSSAPSTIRMPRLALGISVLTMSLGVNLGANAQQTTTDIIAPETPSDTPTDITQPPVDTPPEPPIDYVEQPRQIQPIWASSDSVIATEWACNPDKTKYPSFICPPTTRQRLGTVLIEYTANGYETDGSRRKSEAMVYIPQKIIRQYLAGQQTDNVAVTVFLHGRGKPNIPDDLYQGYWNHGQHPTPANQANFIEKLSESADKYNTVIIAPRGQGRTIDTMSWGYRGQIKDIARMRSIVQRSFPYLNIDRKKYGVFGSSMGGHESLQAGMLYPNLFTAVFSDDGPTNWPKRYYEVLNGVPRSGKSSNQRLNFSEPFRTSLVNAIVEETGGTPTTNIIEYLKRSPIYSIRTSNNPKVCTIPTFIGIGRKDIIVPNSQSEQYLRERSKKCGANMLRQTVEVRYSNSGHASHTRRSDGFRIAMNFFKRQWQKR